MVAAPFTGTSSPEAAEASASAEGNDVLALRRIASEQYEFVWRSLRRLGVKPPETDDAAQHVFLILAGKHGSIEVGRERSYVFGIVMRVAANLRRRARTKREVPEEEAAGDPIVLPAVETDLDDEHARRILDDILARMADERRVVFILFEIEELSLSEIAELLDLPLGTVTSRLRRAREDLRAAVARLRARRQGV